MRGREAQAPPDLVVGDLVIPGEERTRCEVWSRVMGYLRPVSYWNEGKQSEWTDRQTFNLEMAQRRMNL